MSRPIQLPSAQGLHLGTTVPRGKQSPDAIWDDDDGHLITFAPTGAGKGVSCIIPALLTWDGPAIVIDPKGENYAVTAKRRLAFGQRVALLDPFGVTGSRLLDTLNPLDLIDINGPCPADDAAVVAKLLTQGGHIKTDPFWDERAETLFTGLILFTLHTSPALLRNLAEVRCAIESSGYEQTVLGRQMSHAVKSQDVRAAANILALDSNRTRASIITTASSHLSFLREGPAQQCIGSSSIKLNAITGGAPLTIYMVLPPDKLISHGKLLRLWLGVIMAALSRRRHQPERPTLLLIDEAAQLGPLDELRAAVTLMRGYGVRCWSFWQDLSQLKRIYPLDWQSLVNNCAVQQYLGLSGPQVAAEVDAYLAGSSPKPLSQLKPCESLLVRRHQRPQVVQRPDYLCDPLFSGLFLPNPFYLPPPDTQAERGPVPPKRPTPRNVIKFPDGCPR